MIRFINMFDQGATGDFEFAWYDTVSDRFLDPRRPPLDSTK